jgi:hypothetical protein
MLSWSRGRARFIYLARVRAGAASKNDVAPQHSNPNTKIYWF